MHQSTKSRKVELDKLCHDLVPIGEGTYGVVYKGVLANTGKKVAIKEFKKTKEGEGFSITGYRELMLLRELEHENVVKLMDVWVDIREKKVSLVLDFAEYDLYNLGQTHKSKGEPLSPYMVKSLLWQMLNGMHFLHSNWVIHRDLKPANVLVMGDGPERGTVKIADYGLARVFEKPLKRLSENGVVVTIWYRAPELLLGTKHHTKAVDIWGVGCMFAELLHCGTPLFRGGERDHKNPNLFQDVQLDKIFSVLGPPTPAVWKDLESLPDWKTNAPTKWAKSHVELNWDKYPGQQTPLQDKFREKLPPDMFQPANKNALDLLLKMVTYDPNQRITAAAALDHPYFAENPKPGIDCLAQSRLTYPTRKGIQVHTKD